MEVRVAAADDIWLSTGYQRDNAYVAIHQCHRLGPLYPRFDHFLRVRDRLVSH